MTDTPGTAAAIARSIVFAATQHDYHHVENPGPCGTPAHCVENVARATAIVAALSGTPDTAAEGVALKPYLSDRFEWAAPGDAQEDAWIVRFCDKDCGEAIFNGPDAEREAWEYWERYAPSYNIYVFRLARLNTRTETDRPVAEAVERERERAAHDFRGRAHICRTNMDAYCSTSASVWDLAADAMEGK